MNLEKILESNGLKCDFSYIGEFIQSISILYLAVSIATNTLRRSVLAAHQAVLSGSSEALRDVLKFRKAYDTEISAGFPKTVRIPTDRAGSSSDTKNACIVCFTNFRDTIALPCAHFVLCGDCALELIKPSRWGHVVECPVCRKYVHELKHVFI